MGECIGDYQLLGKLGEGGMGVVFKARQTSLDRLVALKLMNLRALVAGADGLRRFQLEAQALAKLDHPNIVSIYEMGEHEGLYYFSMRLIEGGDLNQQMGRFSADLSGAARLILTVAKAVDHAHNRGILHRDLKPSNILIDAEGKPHVTDFGLAKFLRRDADLTLPGMIMGTADYMSPEQARGETQELDRSADIFSLGVVLYRLITGRLPFNGPTAIETLRHIVENQPERPAGINQAIDGELERVCLKCLEKDPRRRYASAADLASDLERWAGRPQVVSKQIEPYVRRLRCKLDCRELSSESLHMRPAGFIASLCRAFPNTEFRILRDAGTSSGLPESINPKNITELVYAQFEHGETVTLEVKGGLEVMAAEFFKVVWEHLGGYSDNVKAAKARLINLIDDKYNHIYDPDLEEAGGKIMGWSRSAFRGVDKHFRAVAIINDRLHNLSLPMIPLIAKYFESSLQISFEVPEEGIFTFTMDRGNDYQLGEPILDLNIEVGTRITIVTSGTKREEAGKSVQDVLENLWQCDQWLRRKVRDFESTETVLELLEFAREMGRSRRGEYGYVKNPFISNLLTSKHVCVNRTGKKFSKEEVLRQLAAPHARIYGLEIDAILARVWDSEHRQPVVLRPGFSVAHGAMDRTPRISITFGVYPDGVLWSEDQREVNLVAMVLCARDTYRTWRDYMKRFAILFRSNPGLQSELAGAQSGEDFVALLRSAETTLKNL